MTEQPQPKVPEKMLLDAITRVLSCYVSETDPYILFNGLLDALLEITSSEYGFIGEVFYTPDNRPFIKSYATSDISWSEETKRLYHETKNKGMTFSRLDSLYGSILKTGQLVISNQPETDPRSCGLPPGHPQLKTFMGIPFYGGSELLGVVGVANRENGYQRSLAESLQPFLVTCGNIIQVYRNNLKFYQVELELHRYREQKLLCADYIHLGAGYKFNVTTAALTRDGATVFLTKMELGLIELLVHHRNIPVKYSVIEKKLWPDVIVGDSSLRTLVRRLRKKLPELSIKTATGVGYSLVIPDRR